MIYYYFISITWIDLGRYLRRKWPIVTFVYLVTRVVLVLAGGRVAKLLQFVFTLVRASGWKVQRLVQPSYWTLMSPFSVILCTEPTLPIYYKTRQLGVNQQRKKTSPPFNQRQIEGRLKVVPLVVPQIELHSYTVRSLTAAGILITVYSCPCCFITANI